MPEPDWQDVLWRCERWLGSRRPQTAAEALREAADALAPDARADIYGAGKIVETFETDLAERLGAEAALLLPSGTMAQQIALRIHCDERWRSTVAWHPTCHLELHEHAGHAHLHGLKAELIGDRHGLIGLEDLQRLPAHVGAVLLELPQREIGGQLPEWEDLVAQVDYLRGRGIAVHLDGARLWEAAPHYARSHAEIAGLFDSTYVSLYKGLGGLAGSVLAGSRQLIEDAAVWRRRHGGTLPRLFPYAAAAAPGLERILPQMPRFLEHARAVAAALAEVAGVEVVPDPPQTPMFHVHLRGNRETIFRRALAVAEAQRVWLFGPPRPATLPNTCMIEVNIGEPALAISPAEAAELFTRVIDRAGG